METQKPYEHAADRLAARFGAAPEGVIVLGSGAGAFVERLESIENRFPYGDVGLASTSVTGHSGEGVLGRIAGQSVLVMSGRSHLYEGLGMEPVIRGVRSLALWGVKRVLFTSAVGSARLAYPPGSFVQITDHINLTGNNPLTGPNHDRLGPRFPDMTTAYDRRLGEIALGVGEELGLTMGPGVYSSLSGPSYETPAEVRMLAMLGGDVVGMSLVPEVIAAVHAGMQVLAIGVVSNFAAGMTGEALAHDEVKDVVGAASANLGDLIAGVVSRW